MEIETGKAARRFEAEQAVRINYPDRASLENRGAEPFQLCVALGRIRPELSPHLVAMDAQRLHGIGKSLAALAVAYCNRGLTPNQEEREETLGQQAAVIAAWYGLKVECGGDPRGYVLRLHGQGLPNNGWGEGFGVA